MAFGTVGIIMLAVVLMFYMKMVDARARLRKKADPIQDIIDVAAVFESIAKDAEALEIINKGLATYVDAPSLLQKKKQLEDSLKSQVTNDS